MEEWCGVLYIGGERIFREGVYKTRGGGGRVREEGERGGGREIWHITDNSNNATTAMAPHLDLATGRADRSRGAFDEA